MRLFILNNSAGKGGVNVPADGAVHGHTGGRAAQAAPRCLAGGGAPRLRPRTDGRPNPAVPFGGKFRIIDFPLSNCINSGIRRIGVATQYKSHSLQRHLQRGWSFLSGQFGEFLEVLSAQQRFREGWYEGTADAIYQNLDIIRQYNPEYVLVLAGDHVYKMDYGKMIAAHVAKGADITVGCIPVVLKEASAFGVMAVDHDDRIVEFAEKPEHPKPMPGDETRALASMGIYVFSAKYLRDRLKSDASDAVSAHDFGQSIIPAAPSESTSLIPCSSSEKYGSPKSRCGSTCMTTPTTPERPLARVRAAVFGW